MSRLITLVSSVVLFHGALQLWAVPLQSDSPQAGPRDAPASIALPAGTKVELAVTNPIWSKTAKPGDPLYSQTNFPVTSRDSIAIPTGTYVEGKIESVTRPTRRSSRAELEILFTNLVLANGYVVVLPEFASAATGITSAPPDPTAVKVTIELSRSNDLLLDNGAQIEMTLAAPVALDARQVAAAIPLSRAPEPGKFKSATLCRPTPGSPGTPGTPDTVIPGSPGTPSTTIPGGPGIPDITIPGTPAAPPTVIPGMPGSAGTPGSECPAPPIVISSVPIDMKTMQGQNSGAAAIH